MIYRRQTLSSPRSRKRNAWIHLGQDAFVAPHALPPRGVKQDRGGDAEAEGVEDHLALVCRFAREQGGRRFANPPYAR
jgi:hypothetical protein